MAMNEDRVGTTTDEVRDHPKWGTEGSHCALCARPFATDTEADRHSGRQCDRGYDGESPCWCESYCWVTWGGECIAEMDYDPASEIVAPLRVEVERLRHGIATAAEMVAGWHDDTRDYLLDLLDD